MLVWQTYDDDGEFRSRAVVYDGAGHVSWIVPIERITEARWIGQEELLVSFFVEPELPSMGWATQLARVRLGSTEMGEVGGPRRHFNIEPSADGTWLSVGVELNAEGESAVEIWDLSADPQPIVVRSIVLDELRWSPDSSSLVAAKFVRPAASEAAGGAGFGGASLAWPRLHRLRPDLAGQPQLLHDGPLGGEPAEGGGYPLWWDESGIYARQRDGLVRCAPDASGCVAVYRTASDRRLMDGRAVGGNEGLVLLQRADAAPDEALPTEIWLVDLATGDARSVYRSSGARFVTDLDWVGVNAD